MRYRAHALGTSAGGWIYPGAVALTFALWVRPLLRAIPTPPLRTIVLIWVVSVLCGLYYVLSSHGSSRSRSHG